MELVKSFFEYLVAGIIVFLVLEVILPNIQITKPFIYIKNKIKRRK